MGSLPENAPPPCGAAPPYVSTMILRPVTPASPCGPAGDEPAGRVDEHPRVLVHHLGGNHAADDLVDDVLAQRVVRDERAVLRRDDDGVDADRLGAVVFNGDLGLAVGAEVVEDAVAPRARQPFHELVREHDRQRHQLVGLGAGVAEHQPLVAGAARVHAHGDVGRLLVDRRQHGAGLVVEAVLRARVADLLDRRADDLLKVDVAGRGDLAGDDGEPGRHQGFAGDAAHRILREDGVEHGVGNLIGDLVGMPLGHRFGREQMAAFTAHACRAPSCCAGAQPDTGRRRVLRRDSWDLLGFSEEARPRHGGRGLSNHQM